MATTPKDSYYALALAIVGQAAKDAAAGSVEAALYLVGPGAELLEAVSHEAEPARRFVSDRFGWPLQALAPLELHQ